MKTLFSFLFLLFSLSLFAQTPVPPPTNADADFPPQEVYPSTTLRTSVDGDTTTMIITGGTPEPDTAIYSFAEPMPQFPGGEDAFKKYLSDSLRHPATERPAPEVATCYIHFIVEKDGSITNVFMAKGTHGYPEFYAEALRVIAAMPKWSPGKVNGQPVRVEMYRPVRFYRR